MHSLSHIGPGDSILNPGVRKIGFKEDASQFTVAHLLVHGWPVQRSTSECNNPPVGDFNAWTQEVKQLTREEREQLPQDSDKRSCHTPWRDQIYYMWNHVFYDVGNWMARMYGTGTFKPPNTEVFAIEFPSSHENGDSSKIPAVLKTWDAETLLVPAYIAPGVTLRVETLEPDQEGEPFHTGDFEYADYLGYVWYVKKGLQLRFYVEGEWDQSVDGLAAVMVYGNMLGEPHQVEEESEDSDESEESEDEDK